MPPGLPEEIVRFSMVDLWWRDVKVQRRRALSPRPKVPETLQEKQLVWRVPEFFLRNCVRFSTSSKVTECLGRIETPSRSAEFLTCAYYSTEIQFKFDQFKHSLAAMFDDKQNKPVNCCHWHPIWRLWRHVKIKKNVLDKSGQTN